MKAEGLIERLERHSDERKVYEPPTLFKEDSFLRATRGSSGCCAVDFYLYYDD